MAALLNRVKQKLLNHELTLGCRLTLASPIVAEALAHCGFDWLVIDAEHGPSDVQNVLAQLQAIDAARANGAIAYPIVQLSKHHLTMIPRVLDCGAQTIMFSSVETAEEAAQIVAVTRYQYGDTIGLRGISTGMRAASYGMDRSYIDSANEQICVIVMVESAAGFANLEAIAATEGVDCIFIGPSDFAASMGHLGNSGHADVQTAIAYISAVGAQRGKAVGIYAPDPTIAKRYQDMGINFIALHADIVWMTKAATDALGQMR